MVLNSFGPIRTQPPQMVGAGVQGGGGLPGNPVVATMPPPNMIPQKTLRDVEIGRRIRFAVYATVLFFAISSPLMYKLLRELIAFFSSDSRPLIDEGGAPTARGLVLTTLVYFVAIIAVSLSQ